MPLPDTPLYYFVMFGTAILIPVLLGSVVLFGVLALQRRSVRHASVSFLGAMLLLAAILANPVTNSLLFVAGSNARVAAMYEEVKSSGFVGRSVAAFSQKFGEPDRIVELGGEDKHLLVYNCSPWFVYGWDTLNVYSDGQSITGLRIKD